ncbi:hypothetical protein [Flavobacterium selenitireducens]|uniref:hypothetical protein n=1 Tax=Flavobacterium selenitireducens TaxID=2722704 RepID=UPI00168BF9F9|nr:hypothetical protein [Flavobacterium selenitireducens]MBD3581743.1 hypothetical protein [Flavobacterium selenitireducens]
MTTAGLTLAPEFLALAADHFRLLTSENLKKKQDTVELRLSGYSDVMFLIADIVKVSLLALNKGENSDYPFIPDPASNVSGVLSVILDLLPYEEANLLDKIRGAVPDHGGAQEEDWDFISQSIRLTAPASLSNE